MGPHRTARTASALADTERYCDGTPESNPAAYADSSVMAHVDQIEGALMLVHGLMDENVHFRHTARLTQALVEAQKSYEMLCFPKERHSPRALKDRIYMDQQISGFMDRWLKLRGGASTMTLATMHGTLSHT
jgi:dipeptidyl-peptidase-4